ncbi:MAG: hypothetical protein K9I29_05590 [Bacteroidales bacterium]|nr:hypothetical protein [Bacteroidales bacterium]MCF8327748.1 hypothetical protein [Bacteroidales bacterium]
MKTYTKILALIFVSVLVVFTSCEDTIDDEDPTADDRDKFLGQWETTETSTLYPQPITFQMNIEKDDNSAQIRLYNIYQLGTDMYAYALVTGNSFTIPQQSVNDMIIEGYGEMVTDNKIDLEYSVNDGADKDEVIGEMIRANPSLIAAVNFTLE